MKREPIIPSPMCRGSNRWVRAFASMFGFAPDDRRGVTLVVVVAMLALLLLLGIAFFSFSAQESESAKYFARSARYEAPSSLSIDTMWDFALRQLIVGPDDNEYLSALWGRRHAMLTNMFGRDVAPYSGVGVHLSFPDANNDGIPDNEQFFVDQNFDGVADGSTEDMNDDRILDGGEDADGNGLLDLKADLVKFNDSPGANRGFLYDITKINFPEPDVNYTYPDINCLFLAYKGKVWDPNNLMGADGEFGRVGVDDDGNGGSNGADFAWPGSDDLSKVVIIPSFHRPQYLRNYLGDWYSNASTRQMVMRPHPEHKFPGTNTPRFLSVASGGVQPFPFARDWNSNTVSGEQGIWTGFTNTQYDLDYDNDGDGVKEGVVLDLGFPVQTDPTTNKKFVPMFSYTVLDADGLLNMNAAGNLNGMALNTDFAMLSGALGANYSVSGSNMGLSPAELNPTYALNADPAYDVVGVWNNVAKPYVALIGRNPGNRLETANFDLLFLLAGRPVYNETSPGVFAPTPSSVFAGRWGEAADLQSANKSFAGWPRAGRRNFDDDGDASEGEGTASQYAFSHPIDYSGVGSNLLSGIAGTGRTVDLRRSGPNGWVFYSGYQSRGTIRYLASLQAVYPAVFPYSLTNQLTDEADETVIEPTLTSQYDSIFGAEDMQGLHASRNDPDAGFVSKRLRDLAPFNLNDSARAAEICEQFTTVSFDRYQFGKPWTETVAGTGGTTVAGVPNVKRGWEYTANSASGGKFAFPPSFGLAVNDAKQPIRYAVRQLLESRVFESNTTNGGVEFRLNLNKFLESSFSYRQLTEHPNDPGSTAIPTSAPYPPATAAQQEYWARRDRQLKARDIYVLLYTLGGGHDGLNYTSTNAPTGSYPIGHPWANQPIRPLYTEVQLQEMAQFAVNLVDALDHDDVITRFEFDKDLSDGWNLDDNPYTDHTSGDTIAATERGLVRGVELQRLTLSEGLVVFAEQVKDATTTMPKDHPATEYDDRNAYSMASSPQGRYFSYFELRNAAPYPTVVSNGNWGLRIEYTDRTAGVGVVQRRDLILQDTTNTSVNPGNIYTIGAADTDNIDTSTSKQRPSYLRVDPNWKKSDPGTINPVTIIPAAGSLSLDLSHESAYPSGAPNRYRLLKDGSNDLDPKAGGWHQFLTDADLTANIRVTLIRREHLGRTGPTTYNTTYDKDNAWIEVDRFTIDRPKTFKILDPSTPSLMNDDMLIQNDILNGTPAGTGLRNLTSQERWQPLYRGDVGNHSQATQANSVGQNNETTTNNLPGGFTLWQPHYDRDFTSVMDLLAIPLYGPEETTSLLGFKGAGGNVYLAGHTTAGVLKFGRTDYPDGGTGGYPFGGPYDVDGNGTPSADMMGTITDLNDAARLDNRWYRLFEFLEVPPRFHASLSLSQLQSPRVPGKVNLNTLRHPGVLGAILDDPTIHNMGLGDRVESDTRHWWVDFLLSRDGRSPYAGYNAIPLPGLPHANPFRDWSYNAPGNATTVAQLGKSNAAIESTLLRSLGIDTRRKLWEVGTRADYDGNSNNPVVEYPIRNRLLGKVANTTTTRSNVFIVWITVDFYEAVLNGTVPAGQANAGQAVYQVGAKLNTLNPHRGFFIVDRSKAEQAYNSTNNSWDFRQLVLYRKTIE